MNFGFVTCKKEGDLHQQMELQWVLWDRGAGRLRDSLFAEEFLSITLSEILGIYIPLIIAIESFYKGKIWAWLIAAGIRTAVDTI